MHVDVSPASPAFALQDDRNVPMARVTVWTDQNTVNWLGMQVDRQGSPDSLDTDLGVVRLFKDGNGNGIFDASDIATDAGGRYLNLMTFGNETVTTGTA